MVKTISTPRKIKVILLNIKMNQQKWVNVCVDINIGYKIEKKSRKYN